MIWLGWGVGPEAVVAGIPHRVKFCDTGVPRMLRGVMRENFLEESRP